MKCKKCGAELKGEWMFCPDCGERLEDESDLFNVPSVDDIMAEGKDTSIPEIQKEPVPEKEEKLPDYGDSSREKTVIKGEPVKRMVPVPEELGNPMGKKKFSLANLFLPLTILLFLTSVCLLLVWLIPIIDGINLNRGALIGSVITSALGLVTVLAYMIVFHKSAAGTTGKVFIALVNTGILVFSGWMLWYVTTYNGTKIDLGNIERYETCFGREEELFMNRQDAWVEESYFSTEYSTDYVLVYNRMDDCRGTEEFETKLKLINEKAKSASVNYTVLDFSEPEKLYLMQPVDAVTYAVTLESMDISCSYLVYTDSNSDLPWFRSLKYLSVSELKNILGLN